MKKAIAFLLALCLLALTGCKCEHNWLPADCDDPETCQNCGETSGVPLGHSWRRATLTEPKTCKVCGKTEGDPLGNDSFMESVDYLSITAMLVETMPEYKPRYAYKSEEETFYVHLYAPEGTAETMAADGNEALCNTIQALSSTIYDSVTATGYTIHCSVILYSDAEPDTILLTATDGLVTYNPADTI